jgi:hypothetical protein
VLDGRYGFGIAVGIDGLSNLVHICWSSVFGLEIEMLDYRNAIRKNNIHGEGR